MAGLTESKLRRHLPNARFAREKHFTQQYEIFSIGSAEPQLHRWPRDARTLSRAGDNRSNGRPKRSEPGWGVTNAVHHRSLRSEHSEFQGKLDWISLENA